MQLVTIKNDSHFIHQVTNFVVVDEYLRSLSLPWRNGYSRPAAEALQILFPQKKFSRHDVLSIRNCLHTGERKAIFPTIFTGKLKSRRQKDLMYQRFFGALDVVLPDRKKRSYIGLTAEQLDMYTDEIHGTMTVAERDTKRFGWISSFHKEFIQHRSKARISIFNEDIFKKLVSCTTDSYNVVDLDLMCSVRDVPQLTTWAMALYQGTQNLSVVNITTSIGRQGVSDLQYHALMPHAMIDIFRKVGYKKAVAFKSSGYKDSSPMRWEHFILEK